jgi:hypothetical protein
MEIVMSKNKLKEKRDVSISNQKIVEVDFIVRKSKRKELFSADDQNALFWFTSPDKFIRVPDHKTAVCAIPEEFGFREKGITAIYSSFCELLGSSRDAWEAIFKMLIKNGNIQIWRNRTRWTIKVVALTNKIRHTVTLFGQKILSEGISGIVESDHNITVSIISVADGELCDCYTIGEIADGFLLD